VTEEEKNQNGAPQEAPEGATESATEERPPETPQDLIEGAGGGATVEAGLDPGPAKGPALDQDEGQIQSDTERNRRKERVGMVVSDAPEKTVTVSVEALVRHPKYKKRVRRSKKFMVHDEGNEARVGDTVRIIETRPISARKRWRLANIVSRAE
jgi:small subunit ribosomal protein S17